MSAAQPPPSFEPWLSRVRMVRAWATVVGFVVVTGGSHSGGRGWDTAIIHGFFGATVLYFLAWASALFLFGELYNVQIQRSREAFHSRELARQVQLRDRYDARMRELHGMPEGSSVDGLGLSTTPFGDGTKTGSYAPTKLRDAA